jgi:hypothetical protein
MVHLDLQFALLLHTESGYKGDLANTRLIRMGSEPDKDAGLLFKNTSGGTCWSYKYKGMCDISSPDHLENQSDSK